jgi:hypothetical protein
MKQIRLLTLMVALFCTVQSLSAQDYKSAIGLRLGYPISVSYKTFISEPGAVEIYAGFRGYAFYNYFLVGAMYQHHFPIGSVPGLKWYVGGGLNALFYNYDAGFVGDGGFGLGINGAVGLDYKFENIPLNLSVDWLPTVYISGYLSGFGGGLGALSARYTLN